MVFRIYSSDTRISYKFVHHHRDQEIKVPSNAKIPFIIEKLKEKHGMMMTNVTVNVIAYDSPSDFQAKRPLANWNTASALKSRRRGHHFGSLLLFVSNLAEWQSSFLSPENKINYFSKLPDEMIVEIMEKLTYWVQLTFLESSQSILHRIGLRTIKNVKIQDIISTASSRNLKKVIHFIRITCDDKALVPLMLHAASAGDIELFEEMIRKGVDPTPSNGMESALENAAKNGHLAIVERIVHFSKVGVTNRAITALREAATNGQTCIVERMLLLPGVCFTHMNLLCNIAKNGYIDVLELLLRDSHVDLTHDKNILFREAAAHGQIEMMRRLLQEPGVIPTDKKNAAIYKASENGELGAVNYLLQLPGVDPTKTKPEGAIQVAAKHGNYDIVERLCAVPGVDVAFGNTFRVKFAAKHGMLELLEQLILELPDYVTVNDNEPFRLAAENGHLDIVERLLQFPGVNATAQDNYAFKEAACNGFLAVVKRLLQIPEVDPTAEDNYAIRCAAAYGDLPMLERLLSVPNVDATAKDNYAIREAAAKGHLSVVERLLQIPTVDATANNNSAFCLAAEQGHLNIVERLLKLPNVDATAQNNYAIKNASANGHLAVVQRLLEVPGVDAAAGNNFAIKNACLNGRLDVVQCLLQVPGVDATADNNLAIQYAGSSFHDVSESIVKLLLKIPGVNAAANDNYAFRHTINYNYNNNASMIKCLMEAPGVDVTIVDNMLIRKAIESGDLALVEKLLKIPQVAAATNLNRSFVTAASNGDVAMVEKLLELPTIDPTYYDNQALVESALGGHLAVVERLLKVPRIDPTLRLRNVEQYDTRCTLYKTLSNSHWDIFERLVQVPKVRAAINCETALEHAIKSGKPNIVASFLKWFNLNACVYDNFAIQCASENGKMKIVEYLLLDPVIKCNLGCIHKSIFAASKGGHLVIVKYFLDIYEVDKSVKQRAFLEAVKHGHTLIVDTLIHQVNPSANGNEAIKSANPMNLRIVERLLAFHGVDASADNNYLLKRAVAYCSFSLIRLLLLIPKVRKLGTTINECSYNSRYENRFTRLLQSSVQELKTSEWVLQLCCRDADRDELCGNEIDSE